LFIAGLLCFLGILVALSIHPASLAWQQLVTLVLGSLGGAAFTTGQWLLKK
jgi:hypothetical protein